jgi:uroporphyrinogen decarboxylase
MNTKPLLSALQGKSNVPPPIWLMRQAGRYLPEYRQTRKEAGGFLNMVYNPETASEITMQPIRRYEMDGAILFSDILIVPHALGQNLEFHEGIGPKLGPQEDIISNWDAAFFDEKADNIYKTVKKVREKLLKENYHKTALIGFAGAPWTTLTYMIEKGPSRDFQKIKQEIRQEKEKMFSLLELVIKATVHYLDRQIEAGAECIKLFDSWAGVLKEEEFDTWVVAPTQKIVEEIRKKHPQTPIIGFPRGAEENYEPYAIKTNVSALAIDQGLNLEKAKELQKICPIQGNLDPELLLADNEALIQKTKEIIENLSHGPFIFNLGHGVIKETRPESVEKLVTYIRNKTE